MYGTMLINVSLSFFSEQSYPGGLTINVRIKVSKCITNEVLVFSSELGAQIIRFCHFDFEKNVQKARHQQKT